MKTWLALATATVLAWPGASWAQSLNLDLGQAGQPQRQSRDAVLQRRLARLEP